MPELANGPSDEQIQEVIDACEAQDKLILHEHMEYMRRIQPIRARRAEIIDIAVKTQGFRRTPLKTKLKERSLLRKAADAIAKLEGEDDWAFYEFLGKSLGSLADLPLGRATMSDARKQRRDKRDSLAELRRPSAESAFPPPAGE